MNKTVNSMEVYRSWLADDYFDADTKRELEGIKGDENEIKDRFYTTLEFGTGGLRGVIGAGTNRMNFYTVGKATQGLANYIIKQGRKAPSVCIAYDSRRLSPEFAKHSALILAANGIKAYIFTSLRPTPEVSFAVRELKATAGIMITASHNPPEYNGYKAYWDDGAQVVSPHDTDIINEVNLVEKFSDCKLISEKEAKKAGLYAELDSDMDDKFIARVREQSVTIDQSVNAGLKVVYTPLNGAGNLSVRRALAEQGFKQVYVVPEQEQADPNFTTLEYPNPEDPKAFTLSLKLAKEKNADIVIATDPDSDRMGCAVLNKQGSYDLLTGNMVGALLCEYIISNKTLPENPAIVSTIVSTDITRAIAAKYGAAYFEVLTGFKNIGSLIKEFEETKSHNYVFGFEESYGYLSGTFARDKDAVGASMLICELAAGLKANGITLTEALNELYERYGYYKEATQSITLKGAEGQQAIKAIMESLRQNPPKEIGGLKVTSARDYKKRTVTDLDTGVITNITLPVSDVLYYTLSDESWFCVRPSGTEPKIKIYFGVKAATAPAAEEKLKGLTSGVMYVMNKEIP